MVSRNQQHLEIGGRRVNLLTEQLKCAIWPYRKEAKYLHLLQAQSKYGLTRECHERDLCVITSFVQLLVLAEDREQGVKAWEVFKGEGRKRKTGGQETDKLSQLQSF